MRYRFLYYPKVEGINDEEILFEKAINYIDQHFPHLKKNKLRIDPLGDEKWQLYTDNEDNMIICVDLDYYDDMTTVHSQIKIDHPSWILL